MPIGETITTMSGTEVIQITVQPQSSGATVLTVDDNTFAQVMAINKLTRKLSSIFGRDK